jgi:23S rRNA (guanosine2251-2'-O)-methyltransferase
MSKAKNNADKKVVDLVYGAHPIIEILKAKRRKIVTIYTTRPEPKAWNRVRSYLPERLPQIQYVTKEALDRLVGNGEHMGIAALVAPFPYRSKLFDPEKHRFLLLIDSVQDVRNLGAMLRSAYVVGVDGVILVKNNAAPLNAAALKASAGLAEHLEIYQANSVKSVLQELSEVGYHHYMAVLEGGENACAMEYADPKVLIIGNEEKGIAKDIQKKGNLITIPQTDPSASLNASVATGMLLLIMKHGLKK